MHGLTLEERNVLVCYILMTTAYRKGEAETYEQFANDEDFSEDVRKKFASNAQYFRDLEPKLENIKNKLDNWRDNE